MATNWGDALLQALRTTLLTVPGLPSTRKWDNQRADTPPTAASVGDRFIALDTVDREVGPDAWKRTTATYRIELRVPRGTDAHVITALLSATTTTFLTAGTISVLGNAVEVLRVSADFLDEPQSLYAAIKVALTFDHA